jgi:hypothetical protein
MVDLKREHVYLFRIETTEPIKTIIDQYMYLLFSLLRFP